MGHSLAGVRAEGVKAVTDSSLPIAQIARELGRGEVALRNWVSLYRREHAREPTSAGSHQPPNASGSPGGPTPQHTTFPDSARLSWRAAATIHCAHSRNPFGYSPIPLQTPPSRGLTRPATATASQVNTKP